MRGTTDEATLDATDALIDSRQPSEAWREARSGCGAGPHLSDGWLAARTAQGYDVRFLTLGDSLEPLAVGAAYLKRPRFRPWTRPEIVLDRAPWSVDASVSNDHIASATVHWARTLRARRLQLQSFDGPAPAADLASLGFDVSERHEFVVELDRAEDDHLAALKSSHRRKIRQAIKAGIEVSVESSPEALALVGSLQGHTVERRRDRGEAMDGTSTRWLELLGQHFLADARVVVGRLEGRPVSAILLGLGGSSAYYFIGGTNADGLRANAASTVMWTAMNSLRADGIRSLNLGGVPLGAEAADSAAHGLYRFKDGWDGERLTCLSGVLDGDALSS